MKCGVFGGGLDRPSPVQYNGRIMKNIKSKNIIRKVRSKANQDVYYTSPQWETKEIEGVTFMAVTKSHPNGMPPQIHWMRKDSMEFIK